MYTPSPATRKHLIQKYGKCIVTGWKNPLEYQMAHIIPRHIGMELDYCHTNNDNNCILLAHGLHALFDNFQWTFDVFSFMDRPSGNDSTFTARIISVCRGQGCISGYLDKDIVLPVEYYPSFYAHYMTYMDYHHTTAVDSLSSFKNHINTNTFRKLQQVSYTRDIAALRKLIAQMRRKNTVLYIDRHTEERYRVIWLYWSMTNTTWEPAEHIPAYYLEIYQNHIEAIEDPDYCP